ncbi:MAG: alanine:cation symporter family protein [Cyanothece sp. SIO2G6]|nr:alanine:cation symporter family protein [Cyanothece sp. SIO2G6]
MLDCLNNFLWEKVLVIALISVGIIFTVASRFVQFRYVKQMIAIFGQNSTSESEHLSSLQALILSVAGRVGAGNIAGVAVAITLGGPGAIFWMWVVGLIGMATSFFECTLAQLFKRVNPDGTYRGGPAYYIRYGLGQWWLSAIFSVLLLVTFGFGFTALQSYTVAESLHDTFGIPVHISGLVLMAVLAVTIFGGVKRIAEVAEWVVPLMAAGYFAIAFFIIATHWSSIPSMVLLIFKSAFGLEQAVGGGIGVAMMFGIKRGLASNEAGLGSAPNVAAVAHVSHPVNQGIVQAFSIFIDTIVLCSCTAAIILLSTVYVPGDALVGGVTLTQAAMADHVGSLGSAFVTIALALFAFTSTIYNYYLGENSLNFFSENNNLLFGGFRLATLALVLWGTSQDLGTVFGFADITMGLLALVNLVVLVALFPVTMKVIQDYDSQIKQGIADPVFDQRHFMELNLDAEAWARDEEHRGESPVPQEHQGSELLGPQLLLE